MSILDKNSEEEQMTMGAKSHLAATGNIMYYISIFGFIVFGIIALIALIGSFAIMRISPGGGIGALLIWGAMLVFTFFLPVRLLYQTATHLRRYDAINDTRELEQAMTKHKSYWKYIGILMIVMLSLMLLALLIGIS